MSADHDDADAPAPDADPFGIVPEDFVETWDRQAPTPVETVAEALRVAEQAPTTTPRAEMDRCPECASTKIHYKPGSTAYAQKRDGDWNCSGCGAHFDDPLPPTGKFGVPEPVCPDCGSWRLANARHGGIECLACGAGCEAAIDASAYVENGQLTLGEVRDGDD